MSFNLDVVHCMVINPAKIDDTLPYIKQDCTVLQLSIDNSMIQKNDNSISYKISGNLIQFIAKPTIYSQFFQLTKGVEMLRIDPYLEYILLQALN